MLEEVSARISTSAGGGAWAAFSSPGGTWARKYVAVRWTIGSSSLWPSFLGSGSAA